MESGRPDLARAADEAAAADADFEASGGVGKGKKNRASSPVSILLSEGQQDAVTETTSAWTGKKKTRIHSTPTSGEHSSGTIVGGEEIEGLDWDDDEIEKKIDACFQQFNDPTIVDEYPSDDESSLLNEEQLRVLNRHLALCRIRADEGTYQGMDDDSMSKDFPLSNLEGNEYYKHYELGFEWYFDPVYCQYDKFQDYQRLMIRDNGQYEDWEYYRRICSTLEGDQEFVQFWENLSSKTELIEWYMTRMTNEPKFERLFCYHTLKIAAGYPNVCKSLIELGFIEFRHHARMDFTLSRLWATFLFEMWKLLKEDKLSFEGALKRVYEGEGAKYSFAFPCTKFEQNLRLLEQLYKPLLDRTVEKVDKADVEGLIKKFVKRKEGKPMTYYDHAKKKLGIAEKIGLINPPLTKAPRDKAVHTVKQGNGSKEG